MSDESDPQSTGRLENRDETITLEEQRLQRLAAEHAAQESQKLARTQALGEEQRTAVPLMSMRPYGLHFDGPAQFVTLPVEHGETGPRWLIELQMGAGYPPVGIEVAGDVVMGVNRGSENAPDLDLGPYRAEEKGVSRRHAMIRPSRNCLYLIDLESTNGTRVNAMPVGYGVAQHLRSYDAISLGALNLTLRILANPVEIDAARAAQPAAEPPTDSRPAAEKDPPPESVV